jgi:ABC-type amino acid transport substrate-binding protein
MIDRRTFCAVLAGSWVWCVARADASETEIMVALANNLYANLQDGQPTGVMVEAIDIILKRMNRKHAYIALPPSDTAVALQDGTIGVNSVAVQTESNADRFWFSDPIVTEYNIVAIRADQSLDLTRMSDLYGLVLGGRAGYQYPLLDRDPKIKLVRFAQDAELIRNLIHKRIDAAVVSSISDVYKLRAEGVMARIKLLGHSVGEVPLRTALSRRLFSKDDLDLFNAHLAELKSSSVWTAILERNGLADLVVNWTSVDLS